MSLGNLGSGLQVVLFEVLRDIAYPCLRGKRGAAVERGRAQFMDPVDTYAVKEGGGGDVWTSSTAWAIHFLFLSYRLLGDKMRTSPPCYCFEQSAGHQRNLVPIVDTLNDRKVGKSARLDLTSAHQTLSSQAPIEYIRSACEQTSRSMYAS